MINNVWILKVIYNDGFKATLYDTDVSYLLLYVHTLKDNNNIRNFKLRRSKLTV